MPPDVSVLPDLLRPGLKVVFVGTAASKRSAALGVPYQGPGNRFWDILLETRMLSRRIELHEYRLVLEYGIGFTNMAPNRIGNDDVLTAADFDPAGVRAKIERSQPRALAFVGKRAAQEFYGRQRIDYGRQREQIGATVVFVLPSTSGAARRYWDTSHWHALAAFLTTLSKADP
jgi:TDG/mug DNA glycosylase family protein